MSARFAHHLPFGAELSSDDRCLFRLWAPEQPRVALAIEEQEPIAMKPLADGWFEIEASCGHGTRYRYRLDDGRLVSDPGSRGQADDIHGPSVVIDPAAYEWRNDGWRGRPWTDAVVYELHAGLMGGFAGVADRLPGLVELGITAIELMPISDFPGKRNWGYDGVLPFAPDRAYGTPDELKALIDAAHGHGLMVLLDVVYNHFGPDGNYLPLYAPQTFMLDGPTDWGDAIDFRRPEVRRYFTENVLYWLMEYRFDGLRLDAVHAIRDSTWLDEMAAEVRSRIEPGRHVHLVLENDANEASHLTAGFDAQWNDDGHHVLHVMLTGETDGYYASYAEDPAAALARCLSEGFVYQGEPMAHRKGTRRGSPSGHLPPTAFVLFLQNHDQIGNRAFGERLTTLADAAKLEAAVALQLLCPQIPLIFMGEEIASPTPFLFFTDHGEELAEAVRKGRAREFGLFKSFESATAALPDPNAPATFAASAPQPDPATGEKRRALYRELLALRRDALRPRLAGTRSTGAEAIGIAAVVARWRLGDGTELTLATNLANEAAPWSHPTRDLLFESRAGLADELRGGRLGANGTLAFLSTDG